MKRPSWLKVLWLVLILVAAPPATALPSHFAVTLEPGLLCNDRLDSAFYYNYLSSNVEPPYKRENGAYWFKVNAELFGKSITEIFVSDGTSWWVFVGALFAATPDELGKSVQDKVGRAYTKREPGNPNSALFSKDTSEIMWQGTQAKLLCRRLVGPWKYG
jgi:hypothetical protein